MNKQRYGVDTIAILRYLAGSLPPQVNNIFLRAEDNEINLVVPSIVIGELIYTIEKGKEISGRQIPKDRLELVIATLFSSNVFSIRDLTPSGWEIFIDSKIPELHDRIIVATCVQENVVGLITSDKEIIEEKEISVIWN